MARPDGHETKVIRPDSMVKKGGKVPMSTSHVPVRPPSGGSKPSSSGGSLAKPSGDGK